MARERRYLGAMERCKDCLVLVREGEEHACDPEVIDWLERERQRAPIGPANARTAWVNPSLEALNA